jgi:hypothetical protein
MVQTGVQGGQAPAVCQQHANQQQEQPAADGQSGGVFGWQLRLVMEYADQVRTQMKPGTVNKKTGLCNVETLSIKPDACPMSGDTTALAVP